MRRLLLLTNAIVALLAAQETSAALSGDVRDIAGGEIPSASVELRLEDPPRTFLARTEDDGTFKFAVLPAGKYTLEVEKLGFRKLVLTSFAVGDGEQKILPPLRLDLGNCASDAPAVQQLDLLPAGNGVGNLRGIVVRSEDHPVALATVKLLCGERKVCGETKTNSRGEFMFFNLAPRDDITIQVTHPGFYLWEAANYEVRAGFDSTYEPITLARRRLGRKRPLVVCE